MRKLLLLESSLLHKQEVIEWNRFGSICSAQRFVAAVVVFVVGGLPVDDEEVLGVGGDFSALMEFDTRLLSDLIGLWSSACFESSSSSMKFDKLLTILSKLSTSLIKYELRSLCSKLSVGERVDDDALLPAVNKSKTLELPSIFFRKPLVRDVEPPELPAFDVLGMATFDLMGNCCGVVCVDAAATVLGLIVLSWSWMSIMWSPRRTLRFNGDFPLKKSFTCESFRDSRACITVFSARCVNKPVSTFGVRTTFDPSTIPLSFNVPSCNSLSLNSSEILSLFTFSFLEMTFLRCSMVLSVSTLMSNCVPVVVDIRIFIVCELLESFVFAPPRPVRFGLELCDIFALFSHLFTTHVALCGNLAAFCCRYWSRKSTGSSVYCSLIEEKSNF